MGEFMKSIQVLRPKYHTNEILDLIKESCDLCWTGLGGRCDDFELEFKKITGAKSAYFTNSATAALHLAFYQLKQKYNWDIETEVISTPLTFLSSNHAILYNNLKPIFADVDVYGCLDPESVKNKINKNTKAVLFVGLGGNIGQLLQIIEICKKHNLKLILDAAHMSGTKTTNSLQHIFALEGLTCSIASFQAVKNLSMADGGMLIWHESDFEELDKHSRQLGWLGISKTTAQRTNEGTYKWYYDCNDVGFKYHGNSVMACFGLVGLKYLEQENAYRRYLCDIYTKMLEKNSKIQLVKHNSDCISSRHLYQILIDKRDEVMLALNQQGIYCGVHYRDNTLYPMYNYAAGTCPKAEEFSNKTISLPLHLHMTVEDVVYVCAKLNEILK